MVQIYKNYNTMQYIVVNKFYYIAKNTIGYKQL
jgi:hypothetical protein